MNEWQDDNGERWQQSLGEIERAYQNEHRGWNLFGSRLERVERGRAVFRLRREPDTAGGVGGGVHGGILAALADVAAVCAASTLCERSQQMRGTAELNISYLRPAIGCEFTITANVIKKGRSLAVIDVEITNDHDTIVVKSRVSYAMGPQPD